MNKTYVLYHANCLDGMMCAAIAYKYFQELANTLNLKDPTYTDEQYLDRVQYIPVKYQEDPPVMEPNSIVYILDFSYPRKTLFDLMEEHKEVLILDHHESAKKQLSGFANAFFNLNESGATMTWNYFFPDKEIPYTVQMIKDRDLWQWQLPDTHSFTEAVYNLLDMDVKQWQRLLTSDNELSSTVQDLINQGDSLLTVSRKQIDKQLNKLYWAKLPQHDELIPMINSPHLISETCEAMYNKFPEAPYVVMWNCEGDVVKLSLRSSKTGANVSLVAGVYGGGGHPHASGATIPTQQWFQAH